MVRRVGRFKAFQNYKIFVANRRYDDIYFSLGEQKVNFFFFKQKQNEVQWA